MNMPCYLMKSVVLASAVFAALSVGATGAHAGVLTSDVYGHDANGPLSNTSQPSMARVFPTKVSICRASNPVSRV